MEEDEFVVLFDSEGAATESSTVGIAFGVAFGNSLVAETHSDVDDK